MFQRAKLKVKKKIIKIKIKTKKNENNLKRNSQRQHSDLFDHFEMFQFKKTQKYIVRFQIPDSTN